METPTLQAGSIKVKKRRDTATHSLLPRRTASVRAARESLVVIAFVALTALMTWPWVMHLHNAVADEGDPYMIAWTLWWDYQQTFNDPLNLFHANVFYPFKYTLAFSEHDYGIALLFFPLFALGFRPLTVHSIATFLGFAFCGYAAFRLARTLTGSTSAAWVAGIFFAFVPHRFNLLAHLHYLFAGWIPLLLEALVLFARERTWKRAAWLGVAFTMNALTCVTWFVLTLAPLALSAAFLVVRYRLVRDRDFWLRGAVALTASTLALLPFLLPYHYASELYGFAWKREDVLKNSPRATAWLAAEARNKLWQGFGARFGARAPLFPGLLAPLFALAAFALNGARVRASDERVVEGKRSVEDAHRDARDSDAIWLGVVWAAVGFLMSLGMNSFFYRIIYDYIYIFRSQRVPARGAMLAYVGLAVLAGLGAARASGWLARRQKFISARTACALIACALLLELRAAPLAFVDGAVAPDAVTLRLKETPMRGGVVELPAGFEGENQLHMLRAADHGRPLVNATSSFTPPTTWEIYDLTREGPIGVRLLDLLEQLPVSYVVCHNSRVMPERRIDYEQFFERAVRSGRLRFVRRFEGRDDLYAVTKTEPEARGEEPLPFSAVDRRLDELLAEDPVNLLGEFFEWGQALERLQRASFGRAPRYEEFMPDAYRLAGGVYAGEKDGRARLENNYRALVSEWAQREAFRAAFDRLSDEQYVDALFRNAGLSPPDEERAALVEGLRTGAETRATTLARVVGRRDFVERENYGSLVRLHYFGYLRRDPGSPPETDMSGFDFWIRELEYSGGDRRRIGRAFAGSGEYLELKKRLGKP